MPLILVSVTPIVFYLVRKQIFFIQKYFDLFHSFRPIATTETASSTTSSVTAMTTTITEIIDPTSIIIEPMANEGSMQTVKQYLSSKGMSVLFRGLSILFILRGRECWPKSNRVREVAGIYTAFHHHMCTRKERRSMGTKI